MFEEELFEKISNNLNLFKTLTYKQKINFIEKLQTENQYIKF